MNPVPSEKIGAVSRRGSEALSVDTWGAASRKWSCIRAERYLRLVAGWEVIEPDEGELSRIGAEVGGWVLASTVGQVPVLQGIVTQVKPAGWR